VTEPAAASRRRELERVLSEEGDRLYALALRVTRDADLAADALHDGFAAAIEKVDEFRGDAALPTWLYRIVYNKAIDRVRERSREPSGGDEPEDEADSHADGSSWARPPDEILLGKESQRALEQALGGLTPVQRAVFELREVEQRSTEEVAEILSLPVGTVRVYLHRARLRLRALLGPHFRRDGR
jgi:RNA polymerase sigma-70 factor (ECF subfamily)